MPKPPPPPPNAWKVGKSWNYNSKPENQMKLDVSIIIFQDVYKKLNSFTSVMSTLSTHTDLKPN